MNFSSNDSDMFNKTFSYNLKLTGYLITSAVNAFSEFCESIIEFLFLINGRSCTSVVGFTKQNWISFLGGIRAPFHS